MKKNINPIKTKKVKELTLEKSRKPYKKPSLNRVELMTNQPQVMGCWNCGADGIHC